MKNRSIGVFDSGLGGLTVLNKLVDQLENENYIYLGDTARLPYGTKDDESIKKFSLEIVRFLLGQGVKALVVACNTMSSFALEEIRELVDIPVIDVIEPGSLAARNKTENKKIGIIATDGTIRSGSYNKKLQDLDRDMEVRGVGCPKLVELIESESMDRKQLVETARRYIDEFGNFPMDSLILGCTHYPIVEDEILLALEEGGRGGVSLIDPALETAKMTRRILKKEGLLRGGEVGKRKYYVTGDGDSFKDKANRLFKTPIDQVEEIGLK